MALIRRECHISLGFCKNRGTDVRRAKNGFEIGKAKWAVMLQQAQDATRIAFVPVRVAAHLAAVGGKGFASESLAIDLHWRYGADWVWTVLDGTDVVHLGVGIGGVNGVVGLR